MKTLIRTSLNRERYVESDDVVPPETWHKPEENDEEEEHANKRTKTHQGGIGRRSNRRRNRRERERAREQQRIKQEQKEKEEAKKESKKEDTYQIFTQNPGRGYRHVVIDGEVEDRLLELPKSLLKPLQVVQLSGMTRKKKTNPCYGMQWGNAIYLYPVEEELIEYFSRPPRPAEYNGTRKFGGRWQQSSSSLWKLIWTEQTIRDFYLENILLHELGHLLDKQNENYADRERRAEAFADEHGQVKRKRGVKRKHHGT